MLAAAANPNGLALDVAERVNRLIVRFGVDGVAHLYGLTRGEVVRAAGRALDDDFVEFVAHRLRCPLLEVLR